MIIKQNEIYEMGKKTDFSLHTLPFLLKNKNKKKYTIIRFKICTNELLVI